MNVIPIVNGCGHICIYIVLVVQVAYCVLPNCFFSHTRDIGNGIRENVDFLLCICVHLCIVYKMSHFISWVHFITLIIHSSGIHTLRVIGTLNAWMVSISESNHAWAYFTRSWHRSDGGVSQEACHKLLVFLFTVQVKLEPRTKYKGICIWLAPCACYSSVLPLVRWARQSVRIRDISSVGIGMCWPQIS